MEKPEQHKQDLAELFEVLDESHIRANLDKEYELTGQRWSLRFKTALTAALGNLSLSKEMIDPEKYARAESEINRLTAEASAFGDENQPPVEVQDEMVRRLSNISEMLK